MKMPVGLRMWVRVQGLKKGDPVIVHPKISNGTCIACRRGEDMHGEGTFPGLDSDGVTRKH